MIINGQKTGLVTVFDLESKMMLKRNRKSINNVGKRA